MNLTEVLSLDGKVMEAQEVLTLDTIELPDGTFPIVKKSPMSLVVTNTGKKKLSLKGSVDVTVLIPCDRCLEEVPVDIPIVIDREIRLDEAGEDDSGSEAMTTLELQGITELEESGITGHTLDVNQLFRAEVLLNWPMKTLCSEDCAGICEKCGTNLNNGSCDCDNTELDPRMAVIQDIFNNNKEV